MTDASTTTERWTCHVYPRRMHPVMERPISVLFEDEVGEDGNVASRNLTASEARALAKALERA